MLSLACRPYFVSYNFGLKFGTKGCLRAEMLLTMPQHLRGSINLSVTAEMLRHEVATNRNTWAISLLRMIVPPVSESF